jgi:exosortase E/protease (VPEID-CTERM system)
VQLPILKILLALVPCAWLARTFLGGPSESVASRWDGRRGALHVLIALGIDRLIDPLWRASENWVALKLLWFPLLGAFATSAVSALFPPRQWGKLVRQNLRWFGPALLMAVCAVAAARLTTLLWMADWLRAASFSCTNALLQLFFARTVSEPSQYVLGTSTFQVSIDRLCSGFEGMGLIAVLLSGYLFLRRRELNFPHAFLLVPLGMTIVWLWNNVRLALLIAVGTFVSPELALQGFHTHAGWIFLALWSWALIALSEKLLVVTRQAQYQYVSAPFLLPLMTLLFSWIVSQAFSLGFDLFYPLRMAVVAAVLWNYRKSYAHLLRRPGLSGLLTGIAVYALWAWLVPGSSTAADSPQQVLGSWAPLWLVCRCLGAVVVVPITEELAFRGFLARRLQNREFETVPLRNLGWPAILLSSLAFGALHQALLAGMLAGVAYAWVARRRGNLADAIQAHGTTNLCLAIQVLARSEWSLWQ